MPIGDRDGRVLKMAGNRESQVQQVCGCGAAYVQRGAREIEETGRERGGGRKANNRTRNRQQVKDVAGRGGPGGRFCPRDWPQESNRGGVLEDLLGVPKGPSTYYVINL